MTGTKIIKLFFMVLALIALASIMFSFRPIVHAKLWEPGGDRSPCTGERPIEVKVWNMGWRRVVETKVELQLWLDGKSDNMLQDHGPLSPDLISLIVPSFSTVTACFGDRFFDSLRLREELHENGELDFSQMIEVSNHFLSRYVNLLSRMEVDVVVSSVSYR